MSPPDPAALFQFDLPWPVLVWIGVLCLMGAFLFAGTETALFSLQKVDRQRFEKSLTGRRIVALLQRRAPLITTLLIGNETVSTLFASTGEELFDNLTPYPWVNRTVNILVIAPMLVLLSEITPKVLAFRFNTTWARLSVWPITAFYWLISPARVLATAAVNGLSRLFGVVPGGRSDALEESELLTLLDQGTASGVVQEHEREIVENLFEFDTLTVGRLMTPRPDLITVSVDVPWHEMLATVRDTGYSRLPVYDTNPDELAGTLLVKDLLRYRDEPPSPRQLRTLLIPPIFVPHSKPATDMLREFLDRNAHIAYVVDEHGTLVGLVTLDDLLLEVFGQMLDYDGLEEDSVHRTDPGTLIVNAGLDVDDFAEATGVRLPPGNYHTVGGFIFHLLGRLPRKGDEVVWNENRFRVHTMEGRRVTELRIELAKPSTPPSQEVV